jgi:hypothetical protein
MKKNYIPKPIDTSDVELPDELNPLLEAMAKNVLKSGRKPVSLKVGNTAPNAMMPKSVTPC